MQQTFWRTVRAANLGICRPFQVFTKEFETKDLPCGAFSMPLVAKLSLRRVCTKFQAGVQLVRPSQLLATILCDDRLHFHYYYRED